MMFLHNGVAAKPMAMNLFKAYILPGLLFQSVVIAGGYATGRELVEFFLSLGPLTGLLALVFSALLWGGILAITFEFARVTRSYDYRTFFKHLLGPGWVLFEICYFALMLVVMAVISNAAGEIAAEMFGMPSVAGTVVLISLICILTFYGSELIEKVLAGWSFLLYGVYAALLIFGLSLWGDTIATKFSESAMSEGMVLNAVRYTGYNMAVIPAIIFCVRHLYSRKQAVGAGLIAGFIAVIPAALFFIVLASFYPQILENKVPVNAVLSAMNIPLFQLVFQVVLFGTFVETGTALMHAINERIDSSCRQQGYSLPNVLRPVTAVVALFLSAYVGQSIGLVELIAKGYGLLTWAFIVVFVFPLFTYGVYYLWERRNVSA